MRKALVLTVAIVFSCMKAYAVDEQSGPDATAPREPDRRPAILHEPSDSPVGDNAALYLRDDVYSQTDSSDIENR